MIPPTAAARASAVLVLAACCTVPRAQTESPAARPAGYEPALVVELADLSRPLAGLENTTFGAKLVGRFGSGLRDLLRAAGTPRTDGGADRAAVGFDALRWLGRTRAELRVLPAGVALDVHVQLHDGAPDDVDRSIEAALKTLAGDAATYVRRDAGALRLGASWFSVALLDLPARPDVRPAADESLLRVRVDVARSFFATGALPLLFFEPAAQARLDFAAMERDLLAALSGTGSVQVAVHTAGDRIAVDVTRTSGVWLGDAGLRLLRLLPYDLHGAWSVANYDLSPTVAAVRAVHRTMPFGELADDEDPLDHLRDHFGIDLGRLVAALEGSFAAFASYEAGGFDPGILYAFALRDPAPVRDTIAALLEHVGMQRAVARREHAGFTREQLAVGPFVVHWAFTEHELLVALGDRLGRDALEAGLERARALAAGEPIDLPDAATTRTQGQLVASFEIDALLDSVTGSNAALASWLRHLASLGVHAIRVHLVEGREGQLLRILL